MSFEIEHNKTIKKIHLSGICGTAMASLAGLLQLQGHSITGSDKAAYPPMSDLLASLNIPVMDPFAEANLTPVPDLVVIGNALSRGNPEVERVLDERIPFTSMAALLHEEFLKGREPLVVAGTHGKTTTTSMLAWIYQTASEQRPELEPSFLIGGVVENFGTSFQLRPTKPFIVEGDEYDTAFFDKGPKFLHYFPDGLILTHVEFDHADIYADLDAVKTAFKRLVNLVPRRGLIVAYDASANVTECLAKAFSRVERYGFTEQADWQLRNLHYDAGLTCWEIWHEGALWAELAMQMAGEHNALNATAAAALAFRQGVAKESIVQAFATFKSVKRRLEVRAEIAGITVIEDFAHHPTAIRETLRALRAVYPRARLWAVLEPRSNTLRRKVLERELVESLEVADRVVLAGVYQQARIPDAERLHPEDVVAQLIAHGTSAQLLENADAIIVGIAPELAAGDVVAILSNGGFDGIYEKLPAQLRARFNTAEGARTV
jgi:UDP-N-acetylmuramate: L-alanyl-gamma-D-glutamyl-meso-diaminopimelate ligase